MRMRRHSRFQIGNEALIGGVTFILVFDPQQR